MAPEESSDDVLYKQLRFPVPPECRNPATRPSNKCINKFRRESVACLQAQTVQKPDGETLRIAAQKICDKAPVLKDPKPPGFSSEKTFPYWVKY